VYASKQRCFKCSAPKPHHLKNSGGGGDALTEKRISEVDGQAYTKHEFLLWEGPGGGLAGWEAATRQGPPPSLSAMMHGEGGGGGGGGLAGLQDEAGYDEDPVSTAAPLLKALLVAALFPQVVSVEKGDSGGGGGGKKKGGGPKLKAREDSGSVGGGGSSSTDVALHPSCVAAKVSLWVGRIFVLFSAHNR